MRYKIAAKDPWWEDINWSSIKKTMKDNPNKTGAVLGALLGGGLTKMTMGRRATMMDMLLGTLLGAAPGYLMGAGFLGGSKEKFPKKKPPKRLTEKEKRDNKHKREGTDLDRSLVVQSRNELEKDWYNSIGGLSTILSPFFEDNPNQSLAETGADAIGAPVLWWKSFLNKKKLSNPLSKEDIQKGYYNKSVPKRFAMLSPSQLDRANQLAEANYDTGVLSLIDRDATAILDILDSEDKKWKSIFKGSPRSQNIFTNKTYTSRNKDFKKKINNNKLRYSGIDFFKK